MEKLWFKNHFWSLYLVLPVCLFLLACQSDDDGSLRPDLIGISEVIAPESLRVGEKAVFILRYDRPTDCHGFLRFDTAQTDAQLRVGLVAGVFGTNCQPVDEAPRQIDFEWIPQNPGPLHIAFLRNPDAGDANFITFEFEVLPE
ncbi:MAG: hypothetical protein RQ735_07575 [Flavobacteriaceae bacterium]|nr:hypothetical protein [Flavobacteriaceae bacterium]